MKPSNPDFQYHVKPKSTGDRITRFMTISLALLTLCTTGLYLYNTVLRKPVLPVDTGGPEIRVTLLEGPVVEYIKAWAGTRNRTQARKYARTVAVLDQCGVMFHFTRKDYEKANAENYAHLKTRIVDPANQTQQVEDGLGALQLETDIFQLDLENQGNDQDKKAILERAKTLEDPYPEEAFERRPSKEECGRIQVMVKAGDFVVRI